MSQFCVSSVASGGAFRRRFGSSVSRRAFSSITSGPLSPFQPFVRNGYFPCDPSSWWYRYVYGLNPRCDRQQKIVEYIEKEGIDPLLLPKDDIEELKRKFLESQNDYDGTEDEDEAWERAKKRIPRRWMKIKEEAVLEAEGHDY